MNWTYTIFILGNKYDPKYLQMYSSLPCCQSPDQTAVNVPAIFFRILSSHNVVKTVTQEIDTTVDHITSCVILMLKIGQALEVLKTVYCFYTTAILAQWLDCRIFEEHSSVLQVYMTPFPLHITNQQLFPAANYWKHHSGIIKIPNRRILNWESENWYTLSS